VREVLALTLRTNAEMVAGVLLSEDASSALVAVAATRTLSLVVDDILHTLVSQARADGRTWQEIGDVLHTTRQAAFQRFRPSDDDQEGAMSDSNDTMPGAAELGPAIIRSYLDGDWTEVSARFDPTMAERFSREMFDGSREQIADQCGRFKAAAEPTVRRMDTFTVVDVPLEFERADMTGRVAFNSDGQVAGLFVLNPTGA